MKRLLILFAIVGLYITISLARRADDNPGTLQVVREPVSPRPQPSGTPQFATARQRPEPFGTIDKSAAPEPPVPRTPPDAEPPSSEQVRDGLEAFFHAEAVDSTWSQATADKLTRGIQGALRPGSRLQRVECRQTLCRIETSHPDIAEFRAYVHDTYLGHDIDIPSGGTFVGVLGEPTAGSPVVAVAYMAGKGNELPGPELLSARP
jgi:hypothetical protein